LPVLIEETNRNSQNGWPLGTRTKSRVFLFICILFNDAVSSLDCMATDDRMIDWKVCGRKWL
jgi:hypothetical protein